MEFTAIIQELKQQKYAPIYFLMGEEPYFIDQVTDYIEDNVLEESERSFNQTVIYGRDTDVATVVSEAKRFPMMAERQVVIVKEAQNLRKIEDLESYAANPQPTTILVLDYKYKKLDKRSKLYKTLGKTGVVLETKKMYDNQIPAWLASYCKSKGYGITPKAAALLVEFLGAELSKITNELEKLMLLTPKGSEITPALIEENIGISKDYNNFEFQKAIGEKDIVKANQIINYFAADPNKHPLVMTMSVLYNFFSKLLIYHTLKDKSQSSVASALKVSPFFVKDYQVGARHYSLAKSINIISYLRDTDLRSKGVKDAGTPAHELLKELVFKIAH